MTNAYSVADLARIKGNANDPMFEPTRTKFLRLLANLADVERQRDDAEAKAKDALDLRDEALAAAKVFLVEEGVRCSVTRDCDSLATQEAAEARRIERNHYRCDTCAAFHDGLTWVELPQAALVRLLGVE